MNWVESSPKGMGKGLCSKEIACSRRQASSVAKTSRNQLRQVGETRVSCCGGINYDEPHLYHGKITGGHHQTSIHPLKNMVGLTREQGPNAGVFAMAIYQMVQSG